MSLNFFTIPSTEVPLYSWWCPLHQAGAPKSGNGALHQAGGPTSGRGPPTSGRCPPPLLAKVGQGWYTSIGHAGGLSCSQIRCDEIRLILVYSKCTIYQKKLRYYFVTSLNVDWSTDHLNALQLNSFSGLNMLIIVIHNDGRIFQ